MWLIVDGYNVLRSSGNTAPLQGNNLREEREGFIARLNRYRGERRDKVTVVFDGQRTDGDFPAFRKQGGVEVIYSRRGQTADEIIKRLVEEASHPQEIIVVSSDREIINFVKSQGASVTGARSLADRLELQIISPDKQGNLGSEEMDRADYYERYVKGYLEEEEPLTSPPKGPSRRPKRRRSSLRLWGRKV